jgi:transposase-like protein
LYAAEDEMSFSVFFSKLKQLGYQLRAVVADDRGGLKSALLKVFPHARLQLCHNHYLENLRKVLNVRTEKRYQHFFNSLQRHVFLDAKNQQRVVEGLRHVWNNRTRNKPFLTNILAVINQRREDLFAFLEIPDCPNTTNIIESYNSHLNGRLKTIKGFESFDSARRWLSAYLVRRRTKQLTDCKNKFKHLNKHASLELTIKKQAQWPDSLTNLGIEKIKYWEKED